MTIDYVQMIDGELDEFLDDFRSCFTHVNTAEHFSRYIRGQLSDLDRKTAEAIALRDKIAPRNLQEFLARYQWDEDKVVKMIHQRVLARESSELRIGVIDETSDMKKGTKTPGVQRQHLGCVGKKDNGIVTVHLAYAQGSFQCVLQSGLFLPEDWANDPGRCRAAGIPEEEIVHKTKPEIAILQIDDSMAHGIIFDAMTFDEAYGRSTPFLRALDERKLLFVGEIPENFYVWTRRPEVTNRPYKKQGRGRGRKKKRLRSDANKAISVKKLVKNHPFFKQEWTKFRIKDTEKGPMIVESLEMPVWIKDENGLPMEKPFALVVTKNIHDTSEIKYCISNASEKSHEWKLRIMYSRWHVERCFQDQKQEVGWDDYQGRLWLGLKRHMILSSVSHLFLQETKESLNDFFPEITVCQIQEVLRSLIRVRYYRVELPAQERAALNRLLDYRCRRNAQARMSHWKRRIRELDRLGIQLEHVISCIGVVS